MLHLLHLTVLRRHEPSQDGYAAKSIVYLLNGEIAPKNILKKGTLSLIFASLFGPVVQWIE